MTEQQCKLVDDLNVLADRLEELAAAIERQSLYQQQFIDKIDEFTKEGM